MEFILHSGTLKKQHSLSFMLHGYVHQKYAMVEGLKIPACGLNGEGYCTSGPLEFLVGECDGFHCSSLEHRLALSSVDTVETACYRLAVPSRFTTSEEKTLRNP